MRANSEPITVRPIEKEPIYLVVPIGPYPENREWIERANRWINRIFEDANGIKYDYAIDKTVYVYGKDKEGKECRAGYLVKCEIVDENYCKIGIGFFDEFYEQMKNNENGALNEAVYSVTMHFNNRLRWRSHKRELIQMIQDE